MDLFFFLLIKIDLVTLKNVRLIGADDVNITGCKTLHIISCDQHTRAFHNPFNLYFPMPVKMVVIVRKDIFLHHNCAFFGNGNGELYYFHRAEMDSNRWQEFGFCVMH